jgi:predicted nucleic acid-binding protein
MDNTPIIIVDADAIVAQASPGDNLHNKALNIAGLLEQRNAKILYPVTAIIEATTHIQRVLNSGVMAYGTAVAFANPDINVLEVNQETIKHALQFFSPTTSKKNTLYDCIVAAVAQEQKADAIFSFDSFYKKKGFKLAGELK